MVNISRKNKLQKTVTKQFNGKRYQALETVKTWEIENGSVVLGEVPFHDTNEASSEFFSNNMAILSLSNREMDEKLGFKLIHNVNMASFLLTTFWNSSAAEKERLVGERENRLITTLTMSNVSHTLGLELHQCLTKEMAKLLSELSDEQLSQCMAICESSNTSIANSPPLSSTARVYYLLPTWTKLFQG